MLARPVTCVRHQSTMYTSDSPVLVDSVAVPATATWASGRGTRDTVCDALTNDAAEGTVYLWHDVAWGGDVTLKSMASFT
jgi:hypothetical protein